MSETVLYFAYGSNMKSARIRERVPSARFVGRAWISGKRLVCNKKSRDGSGKANLVDSPGDVVWGVLYEIATSELERLDRAESGYNRLVLPVIREHGGTIEAVVYVSDKLTSDPVPYDGYKSMIVEGAREHELPQGYIAFLESLPSKPDPRRQDTEA